MNLTYFCGPLDEHCITGSVVANKLLGTNGIFSKDFFLHLIRDVLYPGLRFEMNVY